MPWQDDFFDVDLNQVPTPQLDPLWDSSKSYPREQIDQWVADLDEIQRRAHDRGWRQEDFERLHASADPSERRIGDSYHKFYHHDNAGARMNHDYVKLDWSGDHYEITNGQHRIWLAKQRGLRSIPAHVSAPDQHTLKRLKDGGDRAAPESQGAAQKPIWERRSPEGLDRDSGRKR